VMVFLETKIKVVKNVKIAVKHAIDQPQLALAVIKMQVWTCFSAINVSVIVLMASRRS